MVDLGVNLENQILVGNQSPKNNSNGTTTSPTKRSSVKQFKKLKLADCTSNK